MNLTAQQKIDAMDQQDLRRFFGEMLKEQGYVSSESMAIFGKLINLTVGFRDRWKAEKNEIVTVDDTRKALDAYSAALKEERIPDGLERKIEELVRLWLQKINRKFY